MSFSTQPSGHPMAQVDDFGQLLELLGDSSKPLRPSRLHGLSDLHGECLDRFAVALDSYPVERRRQLMRALHHLAEDSFELSFDAIFQHSLHDADAVVRATAVEGLREERNPRLIGPLLAMLRSDPSARVRAAAAAGLGCYVLSVELEELDTPVEARVLSELLTAVSLNGENLAVRRRALESAAYSGSPEVAEALKQAYLDDDEKMRLSAVLGMGRSCDPRWRPILLEELKSDSAAMRYVAVLACGELGLKESVPVLGWMLRGSDPQLLAATIWALGQIGGHAARQLLLDAYDGADEDTQVALDEALAESTLSDGESGLMLSELDNVEDEESLGDGEEYIWENPSADDPDGTSWDE
jgi:HEAT repeat protein